MPTKLLKEDWEDYDNRKIRDNRDRSKFSCDEPWEVEYLVKVLQKRYPGKTETAIRQAISECCKTVKGSKPREEFVECVEDRL